MYVYSPIERWFNITPPPHKKLSSVSIIITITKKLQTELTPESGGISKLNLEQSFSYIKLLLFQCSLIKKMRNRDLPVTKSLPLLHVYIHTYSSSCTCTYMHHPTYLVVTSFVPFIYCKVSTYLQGQEESRIIVLYIFLVRHASFINFLFFPFPFVARGIEKLLTYLPTLPGFFSWMPFTVFYTR